MNTETCFHCPIKQILANNPSESFKLNGYKGTIEERPPRLIVDGSSETSSHPNDTCTPGMIARALDANLNGFFFPCGDMYIRLLKQPVAYRCNES